MLFASLCDVCSNDDSICKITLPLCFLVDRTASGKGKYTPKDMTTIKEYPDAAIINRNKMYCSTVGSKPFQTHFVVRVILITH